MKGLLQRVTVAAMALVVFACLDTTSPSSSMLSITDALVTLPAGFSSTNNTFTSDNGTTGAFLPPARGHERRMGGRGMMGGGMGADFLGGIGFGRGFDGGPFGSASNPHSKQPFSNPLRRNRRGGFCCSA